MLHHKNNNNNKYCISIINMPIKYTCIFKNKKIIAEYPSGIEQPKLSNTILSIIKTLPDHSYDRRAINDESANINYSFLSENDIVLFSASTSDVKQRIIFDFIDSVNKMTTDLIKNSDGKLVSRTLAKILDDRMRFYNDPNSDKITAVQISIDNAKDAMTENIGKALARGDRLDTLQEKSHEITIQAEQFKNKSTELKRDMCLRNWKIAAMVSIAVIVLIIIIVIIACSGGKCNNAK
jgi:vesicle-associated membrane protein 7